MEHECMIYSNNPEPDRLALYFEYRYLYVSQKIQEICPELWEKLDSNRNFRRRLRTCQWIETWKLPCL